MVEGATNFKKSGYNESDSAELARIAALYQNIADSEMTAGESADFIISQMKAFNRSMKSQTIMPYLLQTLHKVYNWYLQR